MLIYLSSDIETNPCPVTNFSQDFKICRWNSLPADNFVNLPRLEAYVRAHNIDIIRLLETFLDSS